eukprot:2071988-Prymnesium_polylepis.1
MGDDLPLARRRVDFEARRPDLLSNLSKEDRKKARKHVQHVVRSGSFCSSHTQNLVLLSEQPEVQRKGWLPLPCSFSGFALKTGTAATKVPCSLPCTACERTSSCSVRSRSDRHRTPAAAAVAAGQMVVGFARRRCSNTGKGRMIPGRGGAPQQSQWQRTKIKVPLGMRCRRDVAEFNRAFRNGSIWRDDVPGEYELIIYSAPNIVHNRHLLKLVATKVGHMYKLSHCTQEQHTLHWQQPIVDVDGTVLPPGSVNLVMRNF